MSNKLLIIDGNSLMNRVFYALPPMNNSEGKHTNAVYGLSVILLKIIKDLKPNYIAAAFDKKAPTFRHIEYEEYKAGRKKMPDELAEQFPIAKELLRAFNIGIYEIEGYEADDIIGTMSSKFEQDGFEIYILTGDRDSLQLVSNSTKVLITKKGITDLEVYDIEAIREKYGFDPIKIIDLKGLMGDTSDNIPGVPGIGEKTAIKLLSEFGSIENIYENIDKITAKKVKENLINNREQAFLSKKLATINKNVPISFNLNEMNIENYDYQKVMAIFEELDFKSLINKIPNVEEQKKEEVKKVELNFNIDELKLFLKNKGEIYFYYIKEEDTLVFENGYAVKGNFLWEFKTLFEDKNIEKNTYDAKALYNRLMAYGIKLRGLKNDLGIILYLLNPSDDFSSNNKVIANILRLNENQLTNEHIPIFIGFMKNIIEEKLKLIKEYSLEKLLYEIEIPLIEVLASMEHYGFKINKEVLKDIGFKLSEEIDKLTSEIYDIAGEEFNINSPKQLGVILFEKLNLPVIKKTKTGYSTNAEVLEELRDKHEIVSKIITYRQLVKLKTTYIDGLMNAVQADGKIHSNFNQMITATGRISSTEPNLQNIPIKLEQGREIRRAFEPENNNYVILTADYSQIELRLLAHISGDENLIESFKNGEDIHKRTASEVFNIPIDEVTAIQRSRAKAINFGIVYGLSDFGLAQDLKITRKEAKEYIENYFARYTGVRKYLDDVIKRAKENGYVKTIFNRIRFIPEINSSNRNIRMLGERLAMNTPIQGSAADIIKIAMVNVYRKLEELGLKSRIILQVHDELVLEVHKEELEEVKKIVKFEMENCVELKVPLIVDIKWANNWYEAK
ncbi:DNA polymerase I [Caloramator proteoclasticus]|uniref:DNA polymerase I n=1 Tax=Caloramator proteoclasticus DSM 10124 TaxID=1121262 RepID=A0A1M4TG15_9CLOT|nr:DNA polymerase I [Caloramator proteoclasticus]SHE43452.1 DNA polymerase I [Caloramator proteoclasticus DSM 10124]